MGPRRIGAFIAAIATATALLVAPPAAAAGSPAASQSIAPFASPVASDGVSPADPRPPAEIPLAGLLRIVPVEAPPVVITEDDLGEATPPTANSPTVDVEVTLFTEDGPSVPVTLGDAAHATWGGVTSGTRFDGTVAVPAAVADAVADRVTDDALVLDDAETAALVAEVAAEQDAPLAVVDATLGPPAPGVIVEQALEGSDALAVEEPEVLAATASREHTADVIWLTVAGMPSPQAADVHAALGRLSEFWSSESNDQISRIVPRGEIQFRTVSFSPCDERQSWTYAAGQFGRPEISYWGGTTASHLVVLADAAVCGSAIGLGTYGGGVHSGGLIWGTIELGMPPEWDQPLFHEFGHNVGLPHSSARVCTLPKVDSGVRALDGRLADPQCADFEYRDRYDVMGGGAYFEDASGERTISTLRDIAALSVTHKAKLDALPRGSALRTLSIYDAAPDTGALTLDLAPISAADGTRGLEIIDPVSQETVYVEYRSGTGRDAQSLYALWPAVFGTAHFAPGVRVLRSYPDTCALQCRVGYSTVLQRHLGAGVVAPWLGVGDSLTTYTGGVSVRVVAATADQATVEVTFSDGQQRFTSRASPVVQGLVDGAPTPTGRYGTTLRVAGVEPEAWTPAATSIVVRWLRNGQLIPGANGFAYTLNGADIGTSVTARVFAGGPGLTTAVSDTAPVAVVGPVVDRVWGATRYGTAIEVSRRAFPATAPVVYLATGSDYPDALAAAPAAATGGGPLLLVPSAGTVPAAVLERIGELAPARVVIVGGTSAVSAGIVAQVRAAVPSATIERRSGTDRYATARALVDDAFPLGADVLYVATGRDYPDALSAAAVAGGQGAPVLLVDGQSATVDAATRATIVRLAPDRILVAGGSAVVSDGVVADLGAIAATTRLWGPTRYDTSIALGAHAFPTGPVTRQYWATGADFPDALSGAAVAAAQHAPLFVVPTACVPPGTAAETARTGVAAVTLVGGPSVLGAGVAALSIC